jgi:beta-glucanase (GH16 family)
VFGDEFTGSRLDTRKWQSNRYGGTSNDGTFNPDNEWAFFSPRNVTVRNGNAVLQVRPRAMTIDGVSYSYSSGVITTEHRFLVQDGDYVEARIQVPRGAGLFPAFWTQPEGRWPPEIDIAEFYDTAHDSHPTGVYHTADGGNPHIVYGDPATDYRDSWHTFGMLRAAGRIVLYLDGVPHPLPVTDVDTLPQYLLLNLSVYRGVTPPAGSQLLVDWVRAWRPVHGPCAGPACGPR